MSTFELSRRAFVARAAVLAVAAPSLLRAQPATTRILCGYPAGGGVDLVCRKLAERISSKSGVAVIVDNKPGASGRIAVGELKRAQPNSSTMLVTPSSVMTLYPHVYRDLGYDVFVDVTPVASIAATAFALAVGPAVPNDVTNVDEFRRWCKAAQRPASCGNAGAGSMPHFIAILLAREIGSELLHVPFKSGTAAMQAAAAGDVAAALGTESSARPLQQAGKLRILATSATRRTTTFPDAPTFAEKSMPALTQREWFGVFLPGQTPGQQVQALAETLRPIASEPDVVETWAKIGLSADSLGPEQLRAALRSEYDFWAPIIRTSGFTPES